MIIHKNGFTMEIKLYYSRNEIWIPVPEECCTETGCDFRTKDARYQAVFEEKGEEETAFRMGFEAACDTRMKLEVSLPGEEDYYHVIPCNIYGDNHAEEVRNAHRMRIGEFPLLTREHPEAAFCSPCWEFRADRAAMPVSALCCKKGTAAVSVEPYSEEEGREDGTYLKNGLFAALPDSFGVTLGYTNDPVTFLNRSVPAAATGSRGRKASVTGRIYTLAGKGRPAIHDIVRREYEKRHVRPSFRKTFRQAAEAMLDAFCCLNYDPDTGEYTNRKCRPFKEQELKPWRNVVEIGWTGGAILAYPLVMSRYLLGVPEDSKPMQVLPEEDKPTQALSEDGKSTRELSEDGKSMQELSEEDEPMQELSGDGKLTQALPEENKPALVLSVEEKLARVLSGEEMIDRIVGGYREESGFFLDLYAPVGEGLSGRLNGWWTYYGLCRDCHCAYIQGSAVYYILKTILFLKKKGVPYRETWLEGCRKVLDTVVSLQREDGAFGYTYSALEKKVLDWEGFAGCWFVPGLLYLARLTGECSYVEAARKAHEYYRNFVYNLDCWGAPMDTWKAVDQEGNLSFLHGSRLLYEETGEARFLEDMKCSAGYEFLWRYGYPTRPEHPPVKDGWNACGGSVTSVSNPHIHPMGVLADEDLLYLAEVTGDAYYRERALDSAAWMMQTLELYPDKTGYGRYGILSERWCPSDGLVTERYDNGEPYGSWFSYNLWAAANVFEAVLHNLGIG